MPTAKMVAKAGFTSIQDRVTAHSERRKIAAYAKFRGEQVQNASKNHQPHKALSDDRLKMFGEIAQNQNRDCWLMAFQEEKPVYVTDLDPTKLPLTFGEYVELLEWTGRQLSRDKQEMAIPEHLGTLLQRLEIEQAQWLETVMHFGSVFHRVEIKSMTDAPTNGVNDGCRATVKTE